MAGERKVTWRKATVVRLNKYDEKTASEDVILVTVSFTRKNRDPLCVRSRFEWTRKRIPEADVKFDRAWEDIQVGKTVRVYFCDSVFSHLTVEK